MAMLTSEPQLSRGVGFIFELSNAGSYEARRQILYDALYGSRSADVNLPQKLRECVVVHNIVDNAVHLAGHNSGYDLVENYTEAGLRPIVSGNSGQASDDTDRGPYQAWRNGNAGRSLKSSVMSMYTPFLRERAYVLWDSERVEKLRTRIEFRRYREQTIRIPTDREYKRMLDSFEDRSHIWRMGGRGYWDSRDLRRVEYPVVE
jgi:hypothetical protein